MPKRKREGDESLEDKLPQYRTELFRAIKKVKGYERQRQSRHLHDEDITPFKQQRLEREVIVLKSLDLHQTADHYLCSSLCRIKSIANHPNFPEELRKAPPKPDISEEERAALHHVTSGLFNRLEVKEAMERIVGEVCELLEVPLPERKRGKRKRPRDFEMEQEDANGKDDQKDNQTEGANEQEKTLGESNEATQAGEAHHQNGQPSTGTGSNAGDKPVKPVVDSAPKKKPTKRDAQAEFEDEAEQKALARFDAMLGGSDEESEDSDSDSEDGGARIAKGRSIRVRDISVSLSPEPSPSLSPEPEPEPKPSARDTAKRKAAKPLKEPVRDSTFLPTLMGGYISGSDSEASDLDMAPRRNRLGQRQRRLRAEKKHGTKAKHLAKASKGRDDGWDMKRGAVGAEDEMRKPWKRGISNPLVAPKGEKADDAAPRGRGEWKPAEKKDDAPLHPSWAAKKAAKERLQQQQQKIDIRPSMANKIVFDD